MTNNVKRIQVIKIIVVGDEKVGKTCLLERFVHNRFTVHQLSSSIFNNYSCQITVDDETYILRFWDMSGRADFQRLRPLYYVHADCFLICYAVNDQKSFKNILLKWLPEIRNNCSNASIVLVGAKSDLETRKVVLTEEVQKLQGKVKAYCSIECSAISGFNVDEVFNETVRALRISGQQSHKKRNRLCTIL